MLNVSYLFEGKVDLYCTKCNKHVTDNSEIQSKHDYDETIYNNDKTILIRVHKNCGGELSIIKPNKGK